MLLAFLVLNASGRVVVEKRWPYLKSIPKRIMDEFWPTLQKAGFRACKPVLLIGEFIFVHVARGDLTLVGVLGRDAPALMVVSLLHRVGDLLELYVKQLTEDALRANFLTVYQLLDEIIANGVPLHTEPNVLQQLVMQPGKMDSIVASVMGTSQVRNELDTSSSSPWRRPGVRYAANELYLDLHERLDVLIDGTNGVLQSAEVYGEAICNCMLSRMPRLTLTFTQPHIIEDASLHVCANRERWERDRAISFVPPDGKFNLCTYRVMRTNQIPIYVTPTITFTEKTAPSSSPRSSPEPGGSSAEGGGSSVGKGGGGVAHIQATVGARPTDGKAVEEVSVRIPLGETAISSSITATVGSVVFDTVKKELRWEIGRIPKDKLPVLNGSVVFGEGRSLQHLSLSLFVHFKVKEYSASGLKIASLRVENEEHQPYKGVRSITRAGSFEVRC